MKTPTLNELIVNSGVGWTVLSPDTGQATVWTGTRDEAIRWARSLVHETGSANPDRIVTQESAIHAPATP